jgi:hypothetical protein
MPALALICNRRLREGGAADPSYGFGFNRFRSASSGEDDTVLGRHGRTTAMTTTTTALERVTDDVFSDTELRTLAGFLGG